MVEAQIREINHKLDRVLTAIEGDKKLGIDGLASRVDRADKFIQGQKLRNAKHAGIASAILVGWGLLLKFWDKIFQ